MFSSEVGRAQYSLSARTIGIFLGSIILFSVAAALVSAKMVATGFVLTAASFFGVALVRGQFASAVPRLDSVAVHLGLLLSYAVISSLWAIDPLGSLGTTLLALLIGIATLGMRQMIATETRPNLLHMGEGLWMGLAIGLVYLAIELASAQSIKIWLYNLLDMKPGDLAPLSYFKWKHGELVHISRDDLSRNMAPLALFLWPTVAALIGSRTRFRASWIAAAMVVLAIAVIMASKHESSKVAIVGGLLTFALACYARQLTGRLVMVGWVCACLAVLPGVLLAHRLELHKASWIQSSAQHRFIIWNYTAEEVLKSPLFGVGARTTYVLGPQLEAQGVSGPEGRFRRTLSTHSHSVYLQTWFELGLVGAALLTLFGLSILQAVSSLDTRKQPYAYATFTSAAIMAASSFGIWQFWFMALFGYCAMLFGLGSRLLDDAERPGESPAQARPPLTA
jgi:hypothetical protein